MTNPVPVFSCGRCYQIVVKKVKKPSCIVEPVNSRVLSRITLYSPDGEVAQNCPIKRSVVYQITFDSENVGFNITPNRRIKKIAHRCLVEPNEKKAAKSS